MEVETFICYVAIPATAVACGVVSSASAAVSVCYGASAIVLVAFVRLALQQWIRFDNEPPLYGGFLPYVGRALEFGSNHRELLQQLAERSGKSAPAFTTFIAGQRMTFVKNPLHFSSVLKEGRRRLQFRPVATKIMQQAFDCTTADMNGKAYEGWQKLSPKQWAMLRGKPLLELMSRTQEELVDALCLQNAATDGGEWRDTDDMYGVVVDLVFRATIRSFFGSLFDDDHVKSKEVIDRFMGTGSTESADSSGMKVAKEAFRTFDEAFPLLASGVPGKYLGNVAPAMSHLFSRFAGADTSALDKFNVSNIVRIRQEFLHAHFDHHSQGSFQLGFVWATMANTVPTAFWSLYFCTRDREAYRQCREEADRVMGPWLDRRESDIKAGKSPQNDPSSIANILSKMPRLDSIVSEALRMCIASITLREAMEDFELKLGDQSVKVRRGDHVVLAPTMTHFDSDIYPAPDTFKWDRFLVDESEGKEDERNGAPKENDGAVSLSKVRSLPPRFKDGKQIPAAIALQPFGGGHTMCPGRHFALAEIKAFVALVLCLWDIEYDEPSSGKLSMGKMGVPRLEQARAGLGSLPPLKTDKVKCRWRLRRSMAAISRGPTK